MNTFPPLTVSRRRTYWPTENIQDNVHRLDGIWLFYIPTTLFYVHLSSCMKNVANRFRRRTYVIEWQALFVLLQLYYFKKVRSNHSSTHSPFAKQPKKNKKGKNISIISFYFIPTYSGYYMYVCSIQLNIWKYSKQSHHHLKTATAKVDAENHQTHGFTYTNFPFT